MRLRCFFCWKSVSNEVSDDTIVRAVLVCPECIEAGKIDIPDEEKAGSIAEGFSEQPPESS